MSYIPEYHENYYRVEGTAFNQGKIGIGTINPVQLLHVSGGNIRIDGTGYVNGDLNVTGNLNVYGTTAQFAVSQVIAEDKSLELNVATGTAIGGGNYTTVGFSDDAGADFGGLILKSTSAADSRGVTDKHLVYRTASPASGWVSNLRFIVSGNYGKDTLQLSDTTTNVGMTIATDTNLYRSAANTLKTDDNLTVDLALSVNGNATLGDTTSDTHTVNGTLTNSLPDNTATAVDFKESTNSYLKLTTTDGAELVTIGLNPKFSSLNATDATSSTAGAATFAGGVGIAKKLYVGTDLNTAGTTDATNSTTASVTFAGGVGISKKLYVGTDLNVVGYSIRSINATVTAGADAQGNGALTKDINIITTNSSNPGAVTLPTAQAGMRIMIRNTTANGLKVYPATSAQIDALGANTAFGTTLTTNTQKEFYAISATQWYSI